jgi:hypothetical protein
VYTVILLYPVDFVHMAVKRSVVGAIASLLSIVALLGLDMTGLDGKVVKDLGNRPGGLSVADKLLELQKAFSYTSYDKKQLSAEVQHLEKSAAKTARARPTAMRPFKELQGDREKEAIWKEENILGETYTGNYLEGDAFSNTNPRGDGYVPYNADPQDRFVVGVGGKGGNCCTKVPQDPKDEAYIAVEEMWKGLKPTNVEFSFHSESSTLCADIPRDCCERSHPAKVEVCLIRQGKQNDFADVLHLPGTTLKWSYRSAKTFLEQVWEKGFGQGSDQALSDSTPPGPEVPR